jgi:hypothetical protein
MTIPAPQPIRTIGGYPSRNGTPTQLYVDGDFSLTVRDKNGALIYNAATEGLRFSPLLSGIYDFDDVATLLADTSSGFGAGSIWRTRSEGFSYEEAPTSAVDQHVTTAGGVKLYVKPNPDGSVNVKAFGSIGDGVADDTSSVQQALSAFRDVKFPVGRFRLTAPVKAQSNSKISGAGISAWRPYTLPPTIISQGQTTEILVTNHIAFDISATTNVVIDGFGFTSSTATTSFFGFDAEYTAGAIGIYATSASSFRIKNVSFMGLEYGLAQSPDDEVVAGGVGSGQWSLDTYTATDCLVGVRVGSPASSSFRAADFQITNCLISDHVNKHVEVYFSDGVRIENCRFFKGNDVGIDLYDVPFVTLNGVTVFESNSHSMRFTRCKYISGSSIQAVRAGGYQAATPWPSSSIGVFIDSCESVALQGLIERPAGPAVKIENSKAVDINFSILQPFFTNQMSNFNGINGCVQVLTSKSVSVKISLDTVSTNNPYSISADFASQKEITGSISSNDFAAPTRTYDVGSFKHTFKYVFPAAQGLIASATANIQKKRIFVPDGKSVVSRSTYISFGTAVIRSGSQFFTTGNISEADGGTTNFSKRTLATNSTGADAYVDVQLSLFNPSSTNLTIPEGGEVYMTVSIE